MAHSDDIINVGPIRNVRLGNAAAYLYLHEADVPPKPPVISEDDPSYHEVMGAYDADMEVFYGPLQPQSLYPPLERTETFLRGLGNLLDTLNGMDTPTEQDIQFEFYEAAKATFGEDRVDIREFFRLMYQLCTQTPNGPRWGQFVVIYGIDSFIRLIEGRLTGVPSCPRW